MSAPCYGPSWEKHAYYCIKCGGCIHSKTPEIFCDGCKSILEKRPSPKRSNVEGGK